MMGVFSKPRIFPFMLRNLVFVLFFPLTAFAQIPPDRAPVQINKSDLDTTKNKFVLEVFDAQSGQPMKAAVTIFGLEWDKPLELKDTSQFTAYVDRLQPVRVEINAKGYLPFNDNVISTRNDSTLVMKAQMQKIREGASIPYTSIRFGENSAKLLSSSKAPIMAIARFLRANPTAVIEIGGHINSPGTKNSSAMKKLSKARAEAVRDELLTYGIEKKRMKVKGYGNSKMIYKDPKYPHEEEMNRRVEMKVLKM